MDQRKDSTSISLANFFGTMAKILFTHEETKLIKGAYFSFLWLKLINEHWVFGHPISATFNTKSKKKHSSVEYLEKIENQRSKNDSSTSFRKKRL